jgi:hypothetical protein
MIPTEYLVSAALLLIGIVCLCVLFFGMGCTPMY